MTKKMLKMSGSTIDSMGLLILKFFKQENNALKIFDPRTSLKNFLDCCFTA